MEIHYRDANQIVLSRGFLLMRIVIGMQSRVVDNERLAVAGRALVEEHGKLAVVVVISHGTKPPPLADMPQIVAIAKELERYGPKVAVLLGLRPMAEVVFRGVVVLTRSMGFVLPMETQLEAGARRITAASEGLSIDDVLRLYEQGANRLLVQPSTELRRR